MRASIANLGQRGTPVEGDVIGLAALDLVLWIVRARMVSVAFDLEFPSMHADDRGADAAGFGISAHAIMDLEAFRHGCSIRCRLKTANQAALVVNIRAA